MTADRNNQRGFTLLEVIVAATILALLSVGVMSALRTGIAAWQKGERATEKAQRLRGLAELLRREVAGAYPYMVRLEGQTTVAFEGEHDRLSLITSAGSLTAVEPDAGLRAVSLLIDRDPVSGKRGLLLREAMPSSEKVFAAERARTMLLDESVTRIELGYLFHDVGTLQRLRLVEEPVWVKAWSGASEKLTPDDLGDVAAAIGAVSETENEEAAAQDPTDRVLETFQRYFRYRLPRAVRIDLWVKDEGGNEQQLPSVVVPIVGGGRLE